MTFFSRERRNICNIFFCLVLESNADYLKLL